MLDRRVEVFSNIDAKYPFVPGLFELLTQCVDSRIVESHPVDDCLIFGEAEQSGFGVTGLWAWRYSPEFEKAETKPGKSIDRDSILVETGCQSDTVRKLKPHDLNWLGRGQRRVRKPGYVGNGEKSERKVVGILCIKGKQEWPDQGIGEHGQGFYVAGSGMKNFCLSKKK